MRLRAGLAMSLLCVKNDVMANRLREAGGVDYNFLDAFLTKTSNARETPDMNRVGAAFQCIILAPLIVGGKSSTAH